MVAGFNLKNYRMILIHFQGKQFNIRVIQVYSPITDTKEAEVELFYEDLQDILEHPKRDPFHHKGMECKSRKSRDTWSTRQVWTWSTK